MDILKNILDELPKYIGSAGFEGANIVLYTDNENFFQSGESKIKSIVDKIKKRIELRADEKILKSQEETDKMVSDLKSDTSQEKAWLKIAGVAIQIAITAAKASG